MKSMKFAAALALGVATGLAVVPAAMAKDSDYVMVNEDVGLPVFPYDIEDRPYEVLGEIETDVRKATIFSKAPSQEKIYKELWERAEKMGADAVIKASYGDARVTMMSWGASKATGVAIKFVDAPVAAEEEAMAEAEEMVEEAAEAVEEAAENTMEEAVEEAAPTAG